ncbi:sensor histidine kinase [Methylotenera sp. N17]|uniref:sensor histidine kinase n=1 Tax=Methylotenera sp. N17 TaxID=1502761 RepID=UPI000646BA0C|nr:histidine kinase [Methylotenera sp. N17]
MRKNSRLPNLHNFGIHLRILLIVNLFAVLAALLLSHPLSQFFNVFTELSTAVQPILIISLLCLYGLYPWLNKLDYRASMPVIILLEIGITYLAFSLVSPYFSPELIPDIPRACLLTTIVTAIVLYYFNLQQRAYSPAIAEARLQALQARIRPHFLFNSINAVLSLIRSQPKRAETALEDMADLFRVLMADNRDLVPLAQEIALSRQYLALEKLRLEDRLNVNWQIEHMPPDAMIPPLILQPLLENAVYHGIEPLADGGEITIQIVCKHKEVLMSISNPFNPDKHHHTGNKMALKNIKERLLLHFDLEASLKTDIAGQYYTVHIRVPHQ